MPQDDKIPPSTTRCSSVATTDEKPQVNSEKDAKFSNEKWAWIASGAFIAVCGLLSCAGEPETWRGLTIADERRCAPYDRRDYPYSQSVEPRIAAALGSIYSPYIGCVFKDLKETQIEHIVAMSEAHDSGLCAATAETRRLFASDLLNLTLFIPEVNGCGKEGKCDKDASEWLPPLNQCWFAARVVAVRRKYDLTIDRHEADALERVLAACDSTAMIGPEDAAAAYACSVATKSADFTSPVQPEAGETTPPAPSEIDALSEWDDNGNGRISCAEARRHGIAPVPHDHPAYPFMRDGDGDGVVCE